MQDRRPLFWFAAVIALALAAYFYHSSVTPPVESAPNTRLKLTLITGGPDAFWKEVAQGAESAAEEFNAALQVIEPTGTGADQTSELVDASTDEIDGLAISPLAPAQQTRLISELAARIKVVTYDNDAPLSLRHSYIGTNNAQAGRLAAELLKNAAPDGGKIAIFIGDNERQNARDRREAFITALMGERRFGEDDAILEHPLEEALDAGDYVIVATYLDASDPQQAVANAEQALADHDDLAAMVAMYGYNGPACLEALKKADQLGKVAVVAFDEHDATLAGIAEGAVVGTIVQDPYLIGYEAIEELCKLCRNRVTALPLRGAGSIALNCFVVDKENLDEFKKGRAQRQAAVADEG